MSSSEYYHKFQEQFIAGIYCQLNKDYRSLIIILLHWERRDRVFDITIKKLYWINDVPDDPWDLCLHGDVEVNIGSECFKYSATVSSTALYLLKTLTENHILGKEIQMLPCWGFNVYANETLDSVEIVGCPNGIDWSVIHQGNEVKLITESGNEVLVNISEYKKTVLDFTNQIEAFYLSCSPKTLPNDKIDKNGYIAFWNEWHRRAK